MLAVTVVSGELRWEQHPDPVAGDTELLVAVRAAGVNAADLNQRRGLYPAPHGVNKDIPGLELAGEVLKIGRQVTRFHVGDRIMAIVGGGAQATLATVDEMYALPVPPRLSWTEAGGFPEAFSTAYDALWSQAGLTLGERVLVTGAPPGALARLGCSWQRRRGPRSWPRPAARRTTSACASLGHKTLLTQ